jgi:hypothetical protein
MAEQLQQPFRVEALLLREGGYEFADFGTLLIAGSGVGGRCIGRMR